MQPTVMNEDAVRLAGIFKDHEQAGRVLPALLVAACAAADLAVYAWHTPMSGFPTASGMIYLALAFSQISLATIWASLARTDRLFHSMGAASAISLLVVALLRFEPAGEMWFLLVGIHILALAVPLRVTGTCLSREGADRHGDCDAAVHLQFSLRHIFLGMSGAAVGLALLRAADFALRDLLLFCAFGLSFAAIGWIAVWAVYRPSHRWLRLLVLFTFGPIASTVICWVMMRQNQTALVGAHALLAILQTMFLAGALLVLKIAGYRLQVWWYSGENKRRKERESMCEA